jgi:hypothetical protein
MYKVFISSTIRDLAEHRKVLLERLHTATHTPVAMEYFGSRTGDAEKVSTEALLEADVFVGIYARRYGYRPDDDKSITELEYMAAKLGGKPAHRLIYLVQDGYSTSLLDAHQDTDPELLTLLDGFKRRLKKNEAVTLFTSPDDLAARVLADLNRLFASAQTAPSPLPPNSTQITTGDVERGIIGNANITGNVDFGDKHYNSNPAKKSDR